MTSVPRDDDPTISFQTSAHAKCILAGEHAVIHGNPAIVLPVKKKEIKLFYHESDNVKTLIDETMQEEIFLSLFSEVLQFSLNELHQALPKQGRFSFRNTIEIGGGLGFSAALCVIVTRWLIWKRWLADEQLFSFSQHLEDIFHGKSSGVDIVGAISDHLVHFERYGSKYEIESHWSPKLYLSYSGCAKMTDKAVSKVNAMRNTQHELAKHIDNEMLKSVEEIELALKSNEHEGLPLLISAIERAKNCFSAWDLLTPVLQQHLDMLYQLGALAVKPTGAGLGGYVISLWKHEPPAINSVKLIELSV